MVTDCSSLCEMNLTSYSPSRHNDVTFQFKKVAPLAVMLADGGAPTVLVFDPDELRGQMETPPQSLHRP